MINKSELKGIIDDLLDVIESCDEKVDFNIVFQESCSYHRGILARQSRKEVIESKKEIKSPITDGQRDFIKRNEKELRKKGFDIDNIQSKGDAFKVIKAFKEL